MKQPHKIFDRAEIEASKYYLTKPFPDNFADMTMEDKLVFISMHICDDSDHMSPGEVYAYIKILAAGHVDFRYAMFPELEQEKTWRVFLSHGVCLQIIERDNKLCLALENERTDMPDAYIASITPDGVLVYGNSGDACNVLTSELVYDNSGNV